jgi:hypothetical protein
MNLNPLGWIDAEFEGQYFETAAPRCIYCRISSTMLDPIKAPLIRRLSAPIDMRGRTMIHAVYGWVHRQSLESE